MPLVNKGLLVLDVGFPAELILSSHSQDWHGSPGHCILKALYKFRLKSSSASCCCCRDWEAALVGRKLLGFPPPNLILTQFFASLALHDKDTSQLVFHWGWANQNEDLNEVVPILLA